MKQNTAPTCRSIKIVTAFISLLTIAIFIGSLFIPVLIWAGFILLLIEIICFLYSPTAFEIRDKQLVVIKNLGKKSFGPINTCTSIKHDEPSFGIRLWGNGGLFSATGIFWNKQYGIFRAYVTNSKRTYLVLVETPSHKVIISPEKPAEFVNYFDNISR